MRVRDFGQGRTRRSQDERPATDVLPRDIVDGQWVSSSVLTHRLWGRWSQPTPRDHEAPGPDSSGTGKSVIQAGHEQPTRLPGAGTEPDGRRSPAERESLQMAERLLQGFAR
jgi:hypothetical protein